MGHTTTSTPVMTSHKVIIFFTVIGLSVCDLVSLLVPVDDNQQTQRFGGSHSRNVGFQNQFNVNDNQQISFRGISNTRNDGFQNRFNADHSIPHNSIIKQRSRLQQTFQPQTASNQHTSLIGVSPVRNSRFQNQFNTNPSNPHNTVIKKRPSQPQSLRTRRPSTSRNIRPANPAIVKQGLSRVNSGRKIGHQQSNAKNSAHQAGYQQKSHGHEYTVDDQYSGNHYGHSERRNGNQVTGTYYVNLPDGRKQIVNYYADHTGYHPTVTYEGTKTYDSSNSVQRLPIRPRPATSQIDPRHRNSKVGVSNNNRHRSGHQGTNPRNNRHHHRTRQQESLHNIKAHHQSNRHQQELPQVIFPQDDTLSNYNVGAILRPTQGPNQQFAGNSKQPIIFNQDSYQDKTYQYDSPSHISSLYSTPN